MPMEIDKDQNEVATLYMEKGLIFDIRRYSVHDGPGIRTTVFFKGCPLNCVWCHNPESIMPKPQQISRCRTLNGKQRIMEEEIGRWLRSGDIMLEVLKDRLFYEESNGGVTFSGGEPLSQPGFLTELLVGCREEGLHTAVDTSGYSTEDTFRKISQHADVLLFDLKTADKRKHEEFTGVDNTPIVRNLMNLPADGPEVYIRIPVIPGFNSTIEDMVLLRNIVSRVKAPVIRVDLLPFHRLGRQKYEALGMVSPPGFGPETSTEELEKLMQVFAEAGFSVKKGG
jgi:pyruvate formate lyase activating enzyme